MVAEPGRGDDAPGDWGENGAEGLAWRQAEDNHNLFGSFSPQEYLDEFYKMDQVVWAAFSAQVAAAGEGFNGPMVVRHLLGTLRAHSNQMKKLT